MSAIDRDRDALRSALAELRAEEERSGPSFDALLARGRSRRPVPRRQLARLAALAIASVAIVAAVAYRTAQRSDRLVVPSEVIAMSRWRPATDVLLEPTRPLFLQSPRLDASVIVTKAIGEFK
jgi:hypothetical protein